MNESVKKIIKTTVIIVAVFLLLVVFLIAGLIYMMKYKKTDVLQRESRDGQFVVEMQQIGEPAFPFGPVNGQFLLKREGRIINQLKFSVADDGAGLAYNIPIFEWREDCVKIIVSGSEQEDMLYTLYFDGTSNSEKAPQSLEKNQGTSQGALVDTEQQGTKVENPEPEDTTAKGTETDSEIEGEPALSPEILAYYMSIEPTCSYVQPNGLEYRLVAVDRALGSSFYVLVGTYDGENCDFVNADPFNGSGGEARWSTFIDDQLGFACLAKSAGSFGHLYCTRDGGETFEMIEYPEYEVFLANGASFNPFVMPEGVYEEGGLLYLEVGQGADGDYYNEEGFCYGRYISADRGKTWEFLETYVEERGK